jgi:hypothetical protein
MALYRGISLDEDTSAKGKQLESHLRCSSFSHMVRRLIEDRFEAEHLQLTPKHSQEVLDVAPTDR